MRHPMLHWCGAIVALWSPVATADFVLMDQIGDLDGTLASSASSSQFNPATPEHGSITVDNFMVEANDVAGAEGLRLTRLEAVVAQLAGNPSYNLVDSWTVQIYSSLEVAKTGVLGDVHSQSFKAPDSLIKVNDGFFDSALVSFAIDVELEFGEYWMPVAMGNSDNGVVGIRHSLIGDGPSALIFTQAGNQEEVGASAYRIHATTIPGPASLALVLLCRTSRSSRRRHSSCQNSSM